MLHLLAYYRHHRLVPKSHGSNALRLDVNNLEQAITYSSSDLYFYHIGLPYVMMSVWAFQATGSYASTHRYVPLPILQNYFANITCRY